MAESYQKYLSRLPNSPRGCGISSSASQDARDARSVALNCCPVGGCPPYPRAGFVRCPLLLSFSKGIFSLLLARALIGTNNLLITAGTVKVAPKKDDELRGSSHFGCAEE